MNLQGHHLTLREQVEPDDLQASGQRDRKRGNTQHATRSREEVMAGDTAAINRPVQGGGRNRDSLDFVEDTALARFMHEDRGRILQSLGQSTVNGRAA